MLPEYQHDAALKAATDILVTHGHFDHVADVADLSQKLNASVAGMYELVEHLTDQGAIEGDLFNMGSQSNGEASKFRWYPHHIPRAYLRTGNANIWGLKQDLSSAAKGTVSTSRATQESWPTWTGSGISTNQTSESYPQEDISPWA